MGSPYREGTGSAGPAPREEGLVDELIKQFADPLAFYRELVQNSIDADATSIAITVSFDDDPATAGHGLCVASVRDDGTGMDRDILETKLTVLFRSGKEGVEGKIGKFGVGFVSVLAIDPELVVVRTSRGDGDEWTLQLSPDQSYELFRAPGGSSSGTNVSLHVRMAADALDDFVARSERALAKWCRHVEIPVRFVALRSGTVLREARIERPFGTDGLVSVARRDGKTEVSVALPDDGEPYLGLFKRGLLLYETTQALLGAVAVKIQDPHLEHTLSRDNVRRDESYHRALSFARKVIDAGLSRAAEEALRASATSERSRYPQLLEAIDRAGLDVEVVLPLLEPAGGEWVVSASRVGARAWAAVQQDALTAAAAQAGGLVLDASFAEPARALGLLSRHAGRDVSPLALAVTLAQPVAPSPSDLLLVDRLAQLLGRLARLPSGISIAELAGLHAARAYVTSSDPLPALLEGDDALGDPFRLVGRPALVLNASHDVVRAARERAPSEPRYAASILARFILVDRGRLDEEAWLGETAASIAEGP